LTADLQSVDKSVMADVDLDFLARQMERLIGDNARIRDDLRVLTAMVIRLDGTVGALLDETRATHAQIARMNDRISRLEDVPHAH
jgi:hypothetical protein